MDIDHQFGSDLRVGPTGDLLVVAGSAYTRQRVLKRLLTNPGDYLWHLTFGAGLAQFIGQPSASNQVRAVVRGQIFKETAVARSPEPRIDVSADTQGGTYVDLQYSDAEAGQTQLLSFAINT